MSPLDRPPIVRLMEHVEFELNTGCWLWSAGQQARGYGAINVRSHRGNRVVRVHRFSWEVHHGPIPEGIVVCHKCDTPTCCNPAHLFLGTMGDNMRDMVKKGRRPTYASHRGDQSACARLNDEAVLDIRRAERTMTEYANQYGVSCGAVGEIWKGKNWRHLHDGSAVRGPSGNAARAALRRANFLNDSNK